MLCWIFPRCRKAHAWRRHSGSAIASHWTSLSSAARTSVPARLVGARSSMRTFRPPRRAARPELSRQGTPAGPITVACNPCGRRKAVPADGVVSLRVPPAGGGHREIARVMLPVTVLAAGVTMETARARASPYMPRHPDRRLLSPGSALTKWPAAPVVMPADRLMPSLAPPRPTGLRMQAAEPSSGLARRPRRGLRSGHPAETGRHRVRREG